MATTKPYFTHGVHASDRDLVTSTTMYSGQLKRYFSSLDAEIFIGEERILDIVRLDFSYEEKKMPYYGFNSYWPSKIFVGQKMIVGTFVINFTEPGYIAKLLQKIGTSSDKSESIDLLGQTCSLENSPLFGRPFDITVGYGGYTIDNEASFRNTHQVLEGVMVNGYQQILDTSGEPVMETYSFIAKNLKFGGYEFEAGSDSDDNNSDSDIGSSGQTEIGGMEIVEKRDTGAVADLQDKASKDNKLLGVIVDVTNALHVKDKGSHLYIDFGFINIGKTYVKDNVNLTIHDNEVGLSETYTLIKKDEDTFGYILDEERTNKIKNKLINGSQKLVSCSIAGAIMHEGKREPFNKKVCIRPGTNY